ncbi:hypothetical protein P2318_29175 [Myxococcaceae bacterium GXIMD 01537]
MDLSLRKPLFLAALVLLVIAVLVETGSSLMLPKEQPDCSLLERVGKQRACENRPLTGLPTGCEALRSAVCVDAKDEDVGFSDVIATQKENPPTPGLGIPALAVLDALLLFTLVLMGASLLVPERVHGRVQGVASLVGSIVALLVGIGLLLAAFGLLLTMVALFTAVPFGTIAYLAVWGFFNRGGAAGTLGLLMALKVAAAVCLVLAHPRFLQNKGLVLLVLTSLLANAVVSLLHGLVPIILVSITDAIAAIVVLVLALIWAVFLLVGALVSIVKVLRLKRVAA